MAACVRAGRANEEGAGTAVDKAAAAALYRRACDGKDGDGCAKNLMAACVQATLHVNADTGFLYETFRLVAP
jgi:hypothetical protein